VLVGCRRSDGGSHGQQPSELLRLQKTFGCGTASMCPAETFCDPA